MSDIQAISIDTTNDLPKRAIPKDVELSVFQYPYSWKTWRGFWHNIGYFFRCWRPAWHRATKGFARCDTWNVDYSLTAYLISVLTEYRNCANGWPDQHFATFEDWIAAIDECIDNLIASAKDLDEINDYTKAYDEFLHKKTEEWTNEEKEIYQRYLGENEALHAAQCAARKKAFAFLGEYLPHIWW